MPDTALGVWHDTTSLYFHNPYEGETFIISILQMSRQRHKSLCKFPKIIDH
jgi:hypothetical protein